MEQEFTYNPIHDFIPDKIFTTKGEQLQYDLGLKNFKDNVTIQKVLGYSLPIFIITYDSRYPNVNLSATRVKKVKSTYIGKIKKKGIHFHLKNIKLTPPLILNSSSIYPVSGSIIIMRDLAGEFLRKPKVFECIIEENNKLKLVESI